MGRTKQKDKWQFRITYKLDCTYKASTIETTTEEKAIAILIDRLDIDDQDELQIIKITKY